MKVYDVKLSRLVRATPEEVFDVWFDPDCPGGPWHGAKKAMMNLDVDGMFYFAVDRAQAKAKNPLVADGGELLGHFGRFTLVDRPRRVEHTWMSEHTRGVETIVTVTFAPREGGTELTIVHRGIPEDELGRGHERGWTFLLARIAEHLGKEP